MASRFGPTTAPLIPGQSEGRGPFLLQPPVGLLQFLLFSPRVSKVQLDKDGKTWSVLDRIKKKHRNSRSREEGVGRGVTKCAHVLLTRSSRSRGAIGSTRLGCSSSFLSLGSSCVCCSSSRDVSSGAGSPDTPRSSASASTSSPSSLSSSILSSACCRLSVCRDQEKPQG